MLLLSTSAFALPLLIERFETAALPSGWKTAVFSQTGGGAQSTLSVESGALLFTAAPKTRRFASFSKKLDLREVVWLRVSARVKTEGVGTTGAICGMYARFENEEPRAAGGCPTSGDWKPVVRTFAAPAEAHDVEVGFTLTGAGKAWVDDILVEPITPDWKSVGRGNFTYHWFANDTPREEQLVTNDEEYDRFAAFYGLAKPPHVDMSKYPNLDAIEEYTGVRAETVVIGNAIHSIFRTGDRHLARLLGVGWGAPPPLVAEGLAVHLDGEWNGREIKSTARGLVGRGEAPALLDLLDPAKFLAADPHRAYPAAGAFMEWVVTTKGAAGAKDLYVRLKTDAPPDENRKALEAALGKDLASLEVDWRSWL